MKCNYKCQAYFKHSETLCFMIPMTELFLKGRCLLLKMPNSHPVICLYCRSTLSDTNLLKSKIPSTVEIHQRILKNM